LIYLSDPPTTLPEALKQLRAEREKVGALVIALDYHLMPAWVIQDILDENEWLRGKLRKTGT